MKTELRRLTSVHLAECLEVIHKSFEAIAKEYNLTGENCPKHMGFVPLENLEAQLRLGWIMIGLFIGSKLIGYVSLSQESDKTFELHNLSVLPKYRYLGHGEKLLETAKKTAVSRGATKVKLSYIAESETMRKWYESNGFVHINTKKLDHMPFTSGYMEWTE